MTSWYIEADCIDTQELKPWFLTFICIALQSLLAFVLFIRSGPNNKNGNSQKSKSCCFIVNCWRKFKSTKTFNIIVSTYQLWQIISVISVLVFDAMKIYQYITKNSKSPWINYNCYVAITLNSPVLITLVSNVATTSMWSNKAGVGITQNVIAQEADPETAKQVEVISRALLKITDIGKYKLKSPLSAWRQKMFFCLFMYLIFNGVTIIYGVPGIVIFGSTVMIFFCCVLCCLLCGACVDAVRELDEMDSDDKLDENLLNVKDMDIDEEELPEISKCNAFIWVVIMPMFYTISMIICPLLMINFYFGDSWTNSVIDTFNDRHWNEYWEHTKQDYEAKWRLLVSLLG